MLVYFTWPPKRPGGHQSQLEQKRIGCISNATSRGSDFARSRS